MKIDVETSYYNKIWFKQILLSNNLQYVPKYHTNQ